MGALGLVSAVRGTISSEGLRSGVEIGGWFGVHREGVLVLTAVAARDAG